MENKCQNKTEKNIMKTLTLDLKSRFTKELSVVLGALKLAMLSLALQFLLKQHLP